MSDIEITIIDGSDHVGWAAGATRVGELYMTNVKTMVDKIIVEMKNHPNDKISRLNILDHGNKNGIQIGKDWVDVNNLKEYLVFLNKLKPYFKKSSFVHLQHCNIGQNIKFVSELSKALGVAVYAGTGKHNPVYRFNTGVYVKCLPKGKCQTDVDRP
jgi:hypothetical protein